MEALLPNVEDILPDSLDRSSAGTEYEQEEYAVCGECGDMFDSDDLEEFKDLALCGKCLNAVSFICCHCGGRESLDYSVYVGDDQLCESCAENYASTCQICHEWAYDHDMSYVDGSHVCQGCVEASDDIDRCEECGDAHFRDNLYFDEYHDAYYCEHCKPDSPILPYHSGPRLHFYGEGDYHMGVELEVDDGASSIRERSARSVIDIMDDHVYCSNDGSLNTGFEIITHPHTYDELISLPWRRTFDSLISDGWRGHDTDTAGLHVHIGRACFLDDDAITRFCTFFENNWDWIKVFSRREESALDSYAARYFSDDEAHNKKFSTVEVKERTDRSGGRYRAVNLTNYATVEVRVFRSTLKLDTFLAAIELVHLIAEKCNEITDAQAEDMTVSEWLAKASRNLIRYCRAKRISSPATNNNEEAA